MDITIRDIFIEKWKKYFNNSEMPITFWYSSDQLEGAMPKKTAGHRCIIADMAKVRKGQTLSFNETNIGCRGAVRYSGFGNKMDKNFNYFLSCGIPGVIEGERYKKSPEIVDELMKNHPAYDKKGEYLIFKRFDMLEEEDLPEAAIFFAPPDVISGLFTLANFDTVFEPGVITPFGAGCGTAVMHPYLENRKDSPKCILGMFDISARPYVDKSLLTFSIPFKRMMQLIEYMDESFLITDSWSGIRKRIE